MQARQAGSCPFITWGQDNVAVIPGSAQRRAVLSEGGFQLNADFAFEALVSSFPGYADAKLLKDDLHNQSIGYLGDSYKVDAVVIRPGGLQVQVQCTAISQNA